ncbi:RtcB family protein [Patescibacteria group bacterium]|nr:RtcB family protein [Patescibacteria group bacterium]MBU1673124.1 RtcB family protein [Patescibacteria group bacterium]MBU1963802.1 RtcB family protein [Patescibacteria group bacterium]
MQKHDLIKIESYLYEIPKSFREDMNVPCRIYVNKEMLEKVMEDRSLEQAINVATLPGIQKYSIAMPDIHQGYGFPIGGVAAFKSSDGIISPGGVGYDINCGVRLLKSSLSFNEVEKYLYGLGEKLLKTIPSGVGKGGKLKVTGAELDEVLNTGAKWAVKKKLAGPEDLEHMEEGGCMEQADASKVSDQAKARGKDQIGTLGSGNHFIEVQRIDEILDENYAKQWGLEKNQIVIMIHTGSRGLGHQIATDYIKKLQKYIVEKNLQLADRELIYAKFNSPIGQDYLKAMAAGANYAWCNRTMLTHLTRKVWREVFNSELDLVYDVAHNIAKIEEHDGVEMIMHRKGATRAFPDQPVLIPGSMGTASYILAGTQKALEETFGSVCHGAGRTISRQKAKKMVHGRRLQDDLKEKGILVKSFSMRGLAEEAPLAYKDIDNVVNIVTEAGLAKKVAKMKPLVVIKGD